MSTHAVIVTDNEKQALDVVARLTKKAVTVGWADYLHAMAQKNIAEKDAAVALDALIGTGFVKESGEGFSIKRKRHV